MLTIGQHERLEALFASIEHAAVHATWGIYQELITAYRHPDRKLACFTVQAVIDRISSSMPAGSLNWETRPHHARRAADILAYFDRPRTSNGPTEAISGRLEHLRGSALGFRNVTNHIARSLLETGGFRAALHPGMR